MRICPFSGARRTFVRLRPQTGVFARVIYFSQRNFDQAHAFWHGLFHCDFYRDCAVREPHGRTARARFALVWVALYG
nr:MAG TPA: hypothetical protein [Caudoviricetes sp.]